MCNWSFIFYFSEFDKWYSESFLSQTDDGVTTSMGAGHGIRPGVLPPFNPNTVVSEMIDINMTVTHYLVSCVK